MTSPSVAFHRRSSGPDWCVCGRRWPCPHVAADPSTSAARRLHPDWPEAVLTTEHRWDLPTPLDDLAYALTEGPETTVAAPDVPTPTERIALTDVAEVERYYVAYGGSVWTPTNNEGGTELDMVLLMRLTDGRWASVTAWNDYTGWGCQDASYVKVGATRDDVIRYGLDNEGRERLGLTLDA